MKNKILLLAMTLIFTSSVFVGCGTEEEPASDTIGAVSGTVTVEKPSTQEEPPVENQMVETISDDSGSWHESSEEEITEKMIVCFYQVPDATNVRYSLNEEANMAQMEFEYEGLNYTARLKESDEFEDISGCNYAWTSEKDITMSGFPAKVKRYVGADETVDVVLWQIKEAGYVFSLSTSAPDLEGFDITEVANNKLVWDAPEE
ncbi:MAG: hypothetical protein K6D38_02970 [Pseudobutyrivibrio sp.]|nr:hypothetical protein [Pseudobutyrivibrio sp.]